MHPAHVGRRWQQEPSPYGQTGSPTARRQDRLQPQTTVLSKPTKGRQKSQAIDGVGLLPMIGLVSVGMQARAARYTHLPHLGLYAIVVWIGC